MVNQVFEEKVLRIDKSKWKLTKLGTLAEDISIRVDKPGESGYERFVGLDNFISGDIKIKSWASTKNLTSSAKAFKSGDILFARRNAYLRRASLVDFDGCCSGDAFVLRENLDKVVPGFLAFLMNTNALWDYANSNAAGTMSKRVKWRDLAEYQFLLPPIEQQAKLAELLWAMDEVIEKEMGVLESTLIIIESLYAQFKMHNKKWRKLRLGDILHLNYGKPLKEQDRIDGDYPVVTSAGIQGTHTKFLSKGPGIVVGRKGNAGQVTWLDNDFWATDTAYYVTSNSVYNDIPTKFIYYLLKSVHLEKLSIATAVPGLNREDALMAKVYLPSTQEINEYLIKFQSLDNQIVRLNSKIAGSQSLQKSLINQIF